MHKEIYLAGGCFWGTERFIGLLPGVVATEVGYANSTVPSPTYQQVCAGATNAAETVKVTYDPERITLAEILVLYFMTIDPTSLNKQGGDIGTQYRTGIYYVDDSDRSIIDQAISDLEARIGEKCAIEVMPLVNFYPAEDYHQDYLIKNPGGYCHISPELLRFAASLASK